ncbi:MAG: hypothetical protein JRH18_06960 [Deltaproteobacteria bacterium]|nr:hypothetical protein [Deltaproteobacteria bacterium]MBW2151393.1 hypothetical protein [Deltaproteobacteria bacterium]
MNSFKGIGKVHLRRNNISYYARVAWVGARGGKLRVELMGVPGHPKSGFSSDGEWLYYYDLQDRKNPVKRISSRDTSLKRFMIIAITVRDMVSLLSGRVPDYMYKKLEVKRWKASQGYVLVRKKEWWQGAQKIYLGPAGKDVVQIELFEWNSLLYRVEFQRIRSIGQFRIPMRLVFSNENGDIFQLDIERYWANASISSDTFILKPPMR